MKGGITNIRTLSKGGAFGTSEAAGYYIYGKRRDGRTVPCKSEVQAGGGIHIWSEHLTDGPFIEEDMTEFSKSEWASMAAKSDPEQIRICNVILNARLLPPG